MAAGIAEVVRAYTIVEGRSVLPSADVRGLDADEHLRLFAIFLADVVADFGRYLDRGTPDLARRHGGPTANVGAGQSSRHSSSEPWPRRTRHPIPDALSHLAESR